MDSRDNISVAFSILNQMSIAPAGTQAKGGKPKGSSFSTVELEAALCLGGDERLVVDPSTKVNMYGCSPGPATSSASISLASSTASPISADAFAHLSETMTTLDEERYDSAVDKRLEFLRQTLLDYFGLRPVDADIVFVPSGTDATLQSVFLSRVLSSEPTKTLVSLVLAVDEAASRVIPAASGCHFNCKNPRGETVSKGSPIASLHGHKNTAAIRCIELSHAQCEDESLLEQQIIRLIDHNEGTHVLLHAIDASKFGTRTPSLGLLERIQQRYGTDVLTILIDACQLRLSPRRMREHIARGRLITITGSKFLTGPPFSGAIVVPASFRSQIQQAVISTYMSNELASYTTVTDWPQSWTNIRTCLVASSSSSSKPNIGQFLRWTAAVFQLRRYAAVPQERREQFIIEAGIVVRAVLSSVPELLHPLEDCTRSQFFDEKDEEFRHPTIFPFLIRRPGKEKGFLDYEACRQLHHKLKLPTDAFPVACLIGQPVDLVLNDHHEPKAALRLSIDARIVADEYERSHSTEEITIEVFRAQVLILTDKIAFLMNDQYLATMCGLTF